MKTFFEKVKTAWKKLFGELPSWDKAASATLNIVAPLIVATLAMVDPAALPIVQPILEKIKLDLATASTLITEGTSNPTLTGALADIQTNLTAVLKAANITDPATVAKINAFVAEIQAIAAELPATT